MTTKHEHRNIAQARRTAGLCLVILALSGLLATQSALAGVVGFQGLGDLPGGIPNSSSRGVSADGSVVVGLSRSASGFEAFRWTAGGGMVGLGDLPGGTFGSEANATSANGSVVVGTSSSASGTVAFRWTAGGGMVGLGDLPGGSFSSRANATSADGSVVTGFGRSASGNEAFRWTAGGGMVGLGDLPGGFFFSEGHSISADGAVIVGTSSSASGTEAFRWTAGGGMVGLGVLPGGILGSEASATSADGAVVVGSSTSGLSQQDAFIWDDLNGMRSLHDILATNLGLDLTGWLLGSATGISADGLTIVGMGTNPDGNPEGWIATIPEPATLSLVAFGGLALLLRRRRAV